ncbi:MAG: hypothetical protein KGI60_01985 [Patescibacteria group bacterium]|nr:hypothetical protein [Patescibacteria group bacterium]
MAEDLLTRGGGQSSVDVSRVRVYGMSTVSVLAALFFGFGIREMILGGGLNGGNVTMNVAGALLFLIAFLLQVLLVKSMKIQMTVVGLEAVSLALFFFASWSWLFLLAFVLLIGFLSLGVRGGKREIENEMKVSFFKIARHTVPKVITGLSLFVSILYVAFGSSGSPLIGQDTFLAMVRPSEPIVRGFGLKDFSWDMTAPQFAQSVAEFQYGSAFAAATPAMQSQAVAQITSQLRAQAAQYGVVFKNTDTVGGVFYAYMVGQYNSLPTSYKSWIPIAVFVLTFLTVKGLGSIAGWFVAPLGYIIFQLLLASGFAHIQLEQRSREVVVVG